VAHHPIPSLAIADIRHQLSRALCCCAVVVELGLNLLGFCGPGSFEELVFRPAALSGINPRDRANPTAT